MPQLEQHRDEPTAQPDLPQATDMREDTVAGTLVTEGQRATAEIDGSTQEPNAKSHAYDLRAIRTPARFIGNIKENYALNLSVIRAIETYGDAAIDAIKQELNQLVAKKTWIQTKSAKINSKSKHMLLKEKFVATGAFDKLKARLVAGGHRTDPNTYLTGEKSSFTAKHETVTAMLALAAKQQLSIECSTSPAPIYTGSSLTAMSCASRRISWKSWPKSIRNTYPTSKPTEPFSYNSKELCTASPRLENSGMRDLGYERNADDPCLYTKKQAENMSYISLHVGDCFCERRGRFNDRVALVGISNSESKSLEALEAAARSPG
eukprot:gene13362-9567_t